MCYFCVLVDEYIYINIVVGNICIGEILYVYEFSEY